MKLSILRIPLLATLVLSLNACVLVIPWRMAMGGWNEGIPHDPLIYQGLNDTLARQAAAGALIGLREKPFHLKNVEVVPASQSVLLMASLPFHPPQVRSADLPYYKGTVLPVFVKVRWKHGSLTSFDVSYRIIRTPFHSDWYKVYDATGSADATPAFLMDRASDLRTIDQARQMDVQMDALGKRLVADVRSDLPWVVEEVTR